MNYFEHFGIPMSFLLDEKDLKRRFLAMSRKLHPDYFTLEDAMTQEAVLERSSMNNEAYKVLKDPVSRMKYILELKGVLEAEGEQSLPQEFLMEMMEINEALMELSMDPSPDQYATIKTDLEEMENQLKVEVEPVLRAFEEDPGQCNLEPVKDFYYKSKYLLRIKENLDKFASPD